MDKRVILGGVIGGIVILAFGFSILLIVNSFFPTLVAGSNIWIGCGANAPGAGRRGVPVRFDR